MRSALTRAGRSMRPTQSAPPIRQILADRRELLSNARERTQSPLTTLRHYSVTSPGKLVLMLLALFLACLGTGFYASSSLENRTQTLRELISTAEPLAEASQVLYSSLSIADASANSAFIAGGLEPAAQRTRYSDAMATASAALVTAAGGTEQEQNVEVRRSVAADLRTLAIDIPVYTGLIETARVNNRLGNPVGSSYLGQASALMQDTILPAAQRLYERRSMAIADPQSALTTPPWGVYVALLLVIAALFAANKYLARRTRRRFNVGLLCAFVAVVGGTIWLLVSGLTSVAATNGARTDGADPLRELTSARILTQQARSAQTLSLVRRGDQGNLEQTFTDSTARIGEILTDLKDHLDDSGPVSDKELYNATYVLGQWRDLDEKVREQVRSGNFAGAGVLSVGDGPRTTARAYSDLDRALVEAITDTRTSFRDDINTAQRVLGFTGTGILLLTVFAAIAVVAGLVPRIREYR